MNVCFRQLESKIHTRRYLSCNLSSWRKKIIIYLNLCTCVCVRAYLWREPQLWVNPVSTYASQAIACLFNPRVQRTRLICIGNASRVTRPVHRSISLSLLAPPALPLSSIAHLLRIIKHIEENAARLRRAEFRTKAVGVSRNWIMREAPRERDRISILSI